MCSRLAILALVFTVCHAFPQHHGASSYSSFSNIGGGYQAAGNLGGIALHGGLGGGYGGGFGNYGHQQSYVAAVAPVAIAPVAKVVAPVVALGKQQGATSYSSFSTFGGGHQAAGNRGAVNALHGGFSGGFGGGYNGGYRNYGRQQSYVAAVAPVAIAPVAKVVAPVVALGKQVAHQIDYFAHPKYQYEYAVEDKHTGDVKSQHEERDGDNTRGYYTVNEPDGTILTVHYTVDKHSGFQAVVERKGHAAHPQAVKKVAVVAPIVHHAPVVQHAPLLHHY